VQFLYDARSYNANNAGMPTFRGEHDRVQVRRDHQPHAQQDDEHRAFIQTDGE
jgi:hypothetical protein